MPKRHLEKLPVKSFNVAPGDVIGGLIYVMDKPLGIEEGMVGISIDSEPYRQYVKKTLYLLENLRKGKESSDSALKGDIKPLLLRHQDLLARYEKLYKDNGGFAQKNVDEIIDILLKDKVHEKRRHRTSFKEFRKIFFSFSKYHELKGGQSYYVNKGMGGLLFNAYKKKCGIEKRDHFATQIAKLVKDGNKAYMVKQDGQMFLGGTGPGWRKMLKTNTGKVLQRLANPFVIVLTGGLSALAFGIGLGAWRSFYLRKNKPTTSNSDAIIEAISTKMAATRGIQSQEIDTIEGTYTDGSPKVATIVTWAPGCRDLSGKLSGSDDWSDVIVSWDKNGQPIKVNGEGHIIRTKDKDAKGNIINYEKILENGQIQSATQEEYQNAKAVSNDSIAGLGESLISFISMADRDGIGKVGQNKAILPLSVPRGNQTHQFYGIDFGKAYKQNNPIVHSLQDDFSFDNPTNRQTRFVNYSALYDCPLREKMKGVYLLAALRGKLDPELKNKIVSEYKEAGDTYFAEKLSGYPESVGGVNSDLLLVEKEINLYLEKSKTAPEYLNYVQRLKEVLNNATLTDEAILQKFEARLNITPKQIDILDNIEKLTAKKVHTLSPNGNVQLNHIHVPRSDRCAWQFTKNADGTLNLVCQEKDATKLGEIKNRVGLLIPEKLVENDDGKLMIKNLNQNTLNTLDQQLTEHKVASVRNLPYRDIYTRNEFHNRLKKAENPKPKPIPEVTFAPQIQPIAIENTKERKPIMGYMHRVHAQGPLLTPILKLNNLNFNELSDYLLNDENKKINHILDTKAYKLNSYLDNKCISITFGSSKSNKCLIFAQQTPEGVTFSIAKDAKNVNFDLVANTLSKFVTQLTKPKPEFELLSSLSGDQNQIIKRTLEKAIDSGVKDNKKDNKRRFTI